MNRLAITRRATTPLETLVAVGVLATGLSLTAQVLAWTAAERRANQQRQWAAQEAANCLERLRPLDWNQLTTNGVRDLTLSAGAQRLLPHAELKIDVQEVATQLPSKRIRIEVQWTNRAGQTVVPVRLTTWRWKVN